MEYTVQKLASLAKITPRTLRYYDEIGILKPARVNSSGYRIYGKEEVNKLQQILFYRELGIDLDSIKEIITSPEFDGLRALQGHMKKLLQKREQLNQLINNVEKSITEKEGRIIMSDKEKFEGFKQKLIDENDQKYGKEVREKYGKTRVERSNKKVKNMSQEEFDQINALAEEIISTLHHAMETQDPAGELAQKAAELHKKWISYYWDEYNKEAHAGLAQMYVDDERFKAYYDNTKPGTAEFLRDAVILFTQKN